MSTEPSTSTSRSNFQRVDNELDLVKPRVKRNQLRDNLSRWLSPPDPSTNHNNACKAHHTGTAQWFFQGGIFNEWKSTGSFLWVHGKPGSGKSILCSSIIQDIIALRDAGVASMAYFYFDFRDVDKQKLSNLLPSLLIQLSVRSDPCCDILSRLYSSHDRGVQKPSDRAMAECLKEMLTLESQGPTYIIMDALDECPITSTIPSPREEVLDFVDEIVGLHLPNVHICVTSRPEHDIRTILKDLAPRAVSLHDESGQQEDIVNYVTSFVFSDKQVRRWRQPDKVLLIKTLSEKADGMFRWVFCQLEFLRDLNSYYVRFNLEELPESLDETYERMLSRIRKPNRRNAHRLMQCLVVAVRPLRLEELAEILAFDFNAEGIPKLNVGWRWEDQEDLLYDVMSACSSLVMINMDGDSLVIQLSHLSVREFLTANRPADPLADPTGDVSLCHIRLKTAHKVLAQACLATLLGLDDRVGRNKIKDFPLAQYASQYWVTHARFEDESSRIMNAPFQVDTNKPHSANWLWLYNENGGGLTVSAMCPENSQAVPLYYAARLGFRDLAEHLVAKHPEHVNAKDWDKVTSMHVAAREEQVDTMSLLFEHGADVDDGVKTGQSQLLRATENVEVEDGQHLLYRGENINAESIDGWTPLHWAVRRVNIQTVRFLLELGADVNAGINRSSTPLHEAARGNFEILRVLLEHGTNVGAEAVKMPIVADDRTIEVICMLEHGVDVNAGSNSSTPLHVTACGSVEILRMLLEHGANVGAEDGKGKTPLHFVPDFGSTEIVRVLLEHGANVGAEDNEGRTPLHVAARHGSIEVLRVLLEHGANVGAEDNLGRTPLHEAAQHGSIEVVRMLFEHGADVNARSNYHIGT